MIAADRTRRAPGLAGVVLFVGIVSAALVVGSAFGERRALQSMTADIVAACVSGIPHVQEIRP